MPRIRFEGVAIDAGDGATLTKTKEGAGRAKREDGRDARRREREMGNTTRKQRIKGEERKAERRKR
jgi:hypothetical protein